MEKSGEEQELREKVEKERDQAECDKEYYANQLMEYIEEKDSLITAMKLLVEDLNNKGNGTNLNRDEETEQSSLQTTNDIQQTNNPNKVSKQCSNQALI